MKYIWTIVWTFLLIHMTMYVAGSMLGASYDFNTASLLAVGAVIILLIIPAILPQPDTSSSDHH
ncbi:MAG TPA: YjzD family protein [Bacillaceae bacterium]